MGLEVQTPRNSQDRLGYFAYLQQKSPKGRYILSLKLTDHDFCKDVLDILESNLF